MNRRQEVEKKLSRWQRKHHGVISLREARKVGASYRMVRSKAARSDLLMMYPGVFRGASAPRSHLQDLRAATLLSRGAASSASAAWVWGWLCKVPKPIEVTIGRGRRKTRQPVDFTIHRSRDFDRSQCVICRGILVTPRLRTFVDLAATGTDEQLSEALDTALAKKAVTVPNLLAEIRRLAKPGRPGIGRLRQHLADRGFVDAAPPSVLEGHLRRLEMTLGIPVPSIEVVAGDDGQYRLDTAWKAIKFAVEVDGYAFHYSPEHKRRDELRRQRLREQGWTVLVFDWQQLIKQKAWVGNEVRSTYLRLIAMAAESGRDTSC